LLIRDTKDGGESDGAVERSTPPGDARRMLRLWREALTAMRSLGWYVVALESYMTQLELKLAWLETFRLWGAESSDAMNLIRRAMPSTEVDEVCAGLALSASLYDASSGRVTSSDARSAFVADLAAGLPPAVTRLWQLLMSVDAVAEKLAMDMADEEPLEYASRDLVDECKRRLVALRERVMGFLSIDFPLAAATPEDIELLERHVRGGGVRHV
jgi:hypothetical protein